MNSSVLADLERCIRAVAVWQGDNADLYVQWFADPTKQSVIAQVCRSLVGAGVHRIHQADFAALWERAAVLSGRPKTTFLPHHFKANAAARYGTSVVRDGDGRMTRRTTTEYPPYILNDRFLDLNPIVAQAVRYVVEERRLKNTALAP